MPGGIAETGDGLRGSQGLRRYVSSHPSVRYLQAERRIRFACGDRGSANAIAVLAAVCGGIGKAIAGSARGGLLLSIALGFVGALLGPWVAQQLGLPEPFLVGIVGRSFPVLWSIIGAVLLTCACGRVPVEDLHVVVRAGRRNRWRDRARGGTGVKTEPLVVRGPGIFGYLRRVLIPSS